MAAQPRNTKSAPAVAEAPAISPEQLMAALSSLTPGQLASVLPTEVLAGGLALAKKTEADLAREKFDALGMQDLVQGVFNSYDRETWYKTDRVTKQKTTEVSGTGYNVRGSVAIVDGDVEHAVEVQMWVKIKSTVPVQSSDND